MKIERTEFSARLTALLEKAGVGNLSFIDSDDAEFVRMSAQAKRQHPDEDEQQTLERTWFRVATLKLIPFASQGAQPAAIIDAQNRQFDQIHAHLRELTAVHEHLPELERKALSHADQLDRLHTLIELNHEDLSAKLKQTVSAAVTVLKDGQKAVQNEVLRLLSAEHEESRREAEEARRARRNDKRAAALWLCLLTLAFLVMLFWPHRAQGQIVPTNTAYIGGVAVDPLTYDTTNKAIKVNVVAGGAGGGVAQLQVGRTADGAFTNVGYFAGQLNVPVNCVVGCAGGSTTPGDSFANPTTAGITMAFPAVWNGATWDRLYGDKTNGAFVNVKVLPALSAGTAVIGHVIVDSGAVTVSGTVTTTPPSNASTNIAQVVGVAPVAAGVAISTDSVPLTIAGSDYSGTPLKRILKVDSSGFIYTQTTIAAALPAGTNVIGHVIADSGSTTAVTGNVASTVADGADVTLGAKADAKSAATDTTAISLVSILKQISASVQAPPSQAVTNTGTFAVQATLAAETTKVIGTVRVIGNGGANVDAVVGSAVPANAIQACGTDGTNCTVAFIDPCQRAAKTQKTISLASSTVTKLVSLASAKVVYICSINLISATAQNVAIISGTKVTNECDTSTAGVFGGTTAAAGWNLAANGGLVIGNGSSWVGAGGTALDVCIVSSSTGQISGSLTYVQL